MNLDFTADPSDYEAIKALAIVHGTTLLPVINNDPTRREAIIAELLEALHNHVLTLGEAQGNEFGMIYSSESALFFAQASYGDAKRAKARSSAALLLVLAGVAIAIFYIAVRS